MDSLEEYFYNQQKAYEDICVRCGACCGAYDGDPCEHLVRKEDGTYYCRVYENRLGRQKTVNGTVFECVPLREIIHETWVGDERCAYKKLMRNRKVKGM
jgi:uncharacterized cysteine cluster protein YcgN (CxxCxxCC family)